MFNHIDAKLKIARNAKFQFARNHAICFYKQNAIYSYIPKNACSSLRLTAAYENGFVTSIDEGHWIHHNNETFNPSLRELVNSRYSFVVLRCPYRRLVSCFLDKIVNKDKPAWAFYDSFNHELDLNELTFKEFVLGLTKSNRLKQDKHWRPQVDFLIYKKYDDYFCLENINEIIETLSNKGISFVDARQLTNHGTEKYSLLDNKCFAEININEIRTLQLSGKCPSAKSMYSEEVLRMVKALYSEDFELYERHFGKDNLLFDLV